MENTDRKESSQSKLKRGGNRRPQTFRNCLNCNNRFGPLQHLKLKFCSRRCAYNFKTGKPTAKKGKHYSHLQRARIGNCLICKKQYRAIGDWKKRKQKYCSKKCFWVAWKKEIRPKILNDIRATAEKNGSWAGDQVGYSGVHKWIESKLGAPRECEHCGRTDKRKYEWANKDHTYKRVLSHYLRLCTSCHRKYDFANN